MSTKLGVAYTSKIEGHPFQIIENPLTGKEEGIPVWLKSWAFQNEYEALLCLNLFIPYNKWSKGINANEFQLLFKMTLRMLGNNFSEWSK